MAGGYRLTESGQRRATESGAERISENFYEGSVALFGKATLATTGSKISFGVALTATATLKATGSYNAKTGAVFSASSRFFATGASVHLGAVQIQADAVERLTESGSRRITESGQPRGLANGGAGSSFSATGQLTAFTPKTFQNRNGTWGTVSPHVRLNGAFVSPRYVYVNKNGQWIRAF